MKKEMCYMLKIRRNYLPAFSYFSRPGKVWNKVITR